LAVSGVEEKVGPPDATKHWRPRAASLKILAGKCGFAGQPERRFDGSGARENGNVIPVLT
jgi:hypothetical protein